MYEGSTLSTFGTYHHCDHYCVIQTIEDCDQVFSSSRKKFFLGGGSNILLADSSYHELMFVKNNLKGITYLGDGLFRVASGEVLNAFVQHVFKHYGFNAINGRFGLPGTVGGAVAGNAGSFGIEMGDFVVNVRVMSRDGLIESYPYQYAYRTSNLKHQYDSFIVDVDILVPMEINPDIHDPQRYMKRRLDHQEYAKTCGSFFKNASIPVSQSDCIERIIDVAGGLFDKALADKSGVLMVPAGWLIEHAGLKGYQHHGVTVSPKHANFFSNGGNSDPVRIIELANYVKHVVFDRFGVMLEEEVIIVRDC